VLNKLWNIRRLSSTTMPIMDALRLERSRNRHGRIEVTAEQQRITLRGNTTDIRCFEKVFLHRDYFCPFPLKPKIIVDAGANTGLSSLYFAVTYPDAMILAIEPEAENFHLLKHNCAGIDRVKPLRGALWSSQGEVSVTESFDGGAWAFSVEREGKPSLDMVPSYSVPQLIKMTGANQIDLLKLDIEGSEKNLFAGNTDWLDDVAVIVIELHDRLIPDCARIVYQKLVDRPFQQEIRGENIFIRLR
jgi:FkbM family methyltransferase